jgi:hypothetical protein
MRLRGRKKEDAEENCTVKSFMICTPRCKYGEGKNFFRILVVKHEAKKQLGILKCGREDNIS